MIRPVALLLTLLQGAPAPRAPDYPFAVGETLTYSAKATIGKFHDRPNRHVSPRWVT